VAALVAQLSQAHTLHLQTMVLFMDQSNAGEDVVMTQTTTDHSTGKVEVTHFRYHPLRIAEMSKERMYICNNCDQLSKVKTCSLCNCFMPAKAAIPFASCPDGKWREEQ
jgi:hypothetical protein